MVDLQNFEGIAPIFFGLSSPSAISKLEALLPKDLKQIKQSVWIFEFLSFCVRWID